MGGYNAGGGGYGYKWYAQFGALTLSHAQLAKHDEVLRRTAYKDRLGLTLEYSIEDLLSKTVAFDELPAGAKAAWRSAKNEDVVTSHVDPKAVHSPAVETIVPYVTDDDERAEERDLQLQITF